MNTITHHDFAQFLLQVCLMLVAALLGGHLMRRLNQPTVLGELIVGIILGPTIFGTLFPAAHSYLFPDRNTLFFARDIIIRIGMLFFMFIAGLEVNLNQLRQKGRMISMTSFMGILVPFGFGFISVLAFPSLWNSDAHDNRVVLALFMGTALSISALPVIARILIDLNLIQTDLGLVIMTAATLNDLFGWSIFAILLSSVATGISMMNILKTLAIVAGFSIFVILLGRWPGRSVLRCTQSALAWPNGFIGVITIGILATASTAEYIGLHAIFGAFLLGIALRSSLEDDGCHHPKEIISQFAVSFFAPLYFVSIGLTINYTAHFNLLLTVMVLLIACAGKIAGASLGAWLGGMTSRHAWAVGFGMNARGAIEIIMASIALESHLIDESIFVSLVIMALVTSMISGPMLRVLTRNDCEKGSLVVP